MDRSGGGGTDAWVLHVSTPPFAPYSGGGSLLATIDSVHRLNYDQEESESKPRMVKRIAGAASY